MAEFGSPVSLTDTGRHKSAAAGPLRLNRRNRRKADMFELAFRPAGPRPTRCTHSNRPTAEQRSAFRRDGDETRHAFSPYAANCSRHERCAPATGNAAPRRRRARSPGPSPAWRRGRFRSVRAPRSLSGRAPVAAAKMVSPSIGACAGSTARASPSCAMIASRLACGLVSAASVATSPIVVLVPGAPFSRRRRVERLPASRGRRTRRPARTARPRTTGRRRSAASRPR